jgi:hypothetical protein
MRKMQRRQMPFISPRLLSTWLLMQPGGERAIAIRDIRARSVRRKLAPATPSPKTHSQEELWRLFTMAKAFLWATHVLVAIGGANLSAA